MGIHSGITLDGKHTFKDFGLLMSSYYIPEPEPKIERIDIPFSSGSIDLTDVTGNTPYNDRDGLQFEFSLVDGSHYNFAKKVSDIAMFIHGKRMKMISDYELDYYYMVRLSVDPVKTSRLTGKIVLKGISDPFKYDLLASNEPWLWDPFSFPDGEIKPTLSDIDVNGIKNVTIRAGGVPVSPVFYVYSSNNLRFTFDNELYRLKKDNPNKAYEVYKFPQVKVGDKDKTIKLEGIGKLSIEYRGRFL